MSFYKFANMTEQEQIELLRYTFQEFDIRADANAFHHALRGNVRHMTDIRKRISCKLSVSPDEAASLDAFDAANLNPKSRKPTKKRTIVRVKYLAVIETLLAKGYGWRKIHGYITAMEKKNFISVTGLEFVYGEIRPREVRLHRH